MATNPYSAAAEGIESGFRMGLKLDELKEEKRARQFQEQRQVGADMRAADELELHKQREARNEERLANQEKREAGDRAARMLERRQGDIVTASKARAAQGLGVDPSMADEYGRNAEQLGQMRQDALNFWSRAQTGQLDPSKASSKDLYMNLTAATGMLPEELNNVPKHVADVQAGIETGNQGLLLQGVNGIMAPRLRKGVGTPSPYGGTITKKEIIGLDPARDANGVDHPDKFIPRIRVYVKKDDGSTGYYDAPATAGGSTDPDAKVDATSVQDAMTYMGQMNTLAQAMQHPEMQAKLAEGQKVAGAQAQKYLDELNALSQPAKRKTVTETIDQGNKKTVIHRDQETGKEVSREEFPVAAKPMNFRPSGGGARGALQARLDALEDDHDSGVIDDDEYREQRKTILTGKAPAKGGAAAKGPSNAEQNSAVRGAVQGVASKLGLSYDSTLKQYRNNDGTPATKEQKQKLADAETAATKAVRDAAAKGQRVSGEDLEKATGATAPKAKYTEGQTATNPTTGEKLIFKGGAWQKVQ